MDVADAALRLLVRRDWDGIGRVALHGAEDLTLDEVAAVFERVLERPIRYQEVAANTFARMFIGRGLSPDYLHHPVAMFAAWTQGTARTDLCMTETVTPTRLEDWVRAELLPRLAPPIEAECCQGCHA